MKAEQPVQINNRGLVSIDILRGLAAAGVFCYHQHIGSLIDQSIGITFFTYADTFGAGYAVPLFFLISGFCIHLPNIKYLKEGKPLPINEYLKRRFLRIYPPYLAALIFSLAINYLVMPNYTISYADILTHIFLFQGFSTLYFNSINVVLWTISVEFALYLLYPIFYYTRSKTTLKMALVIAGLTSLISISIIEYFALNTTVAFFFVNLWFSWCCGAFIAESMILSPGELKKPVYKLLYGLIIAGYFLSGDSRFLLIRFPLMILIWTGPLILLLNLEDKLSQSNFILIRLFTYLGLSSYSLYLLHEPLINLKNCLAHLLPSPALQKLGMILGILLIPMITWLSYLYIEKPFMRKKTASLR